MTYDIIILGFYFAFLFYFGWKAKKKDPTEEEYLLSSRSLSLPALIATLVTTWYGGILGIGEFIYGNGISTWLVFGLPYYFFAVLFALFAAPKIRSAKYLSIPDLLYKNYGKATGLLGSFFIIFITSPAPYILISGILLGYLLHIPQQIAILLSAFFSVVYLFKGGFRSVVQTDKFQFVLMFSGFLTLLIFLMLKIGSPLDQFALLSESYKNLNGGLSIQEIIVWFLIASWTFIDPSFHQRTAAARSPQIARKAILVSIIFWFVFDMLTLWTGIYAINLLQNINPLMLYPLLAEHVLPPIIKSVFIIGLLAIAMSTTDSFAFISAQTIGRDIIAYWNKKDSSAEIMHYTQIGLIMTTLVAVLLIWFFPSVISLWYNLGSLFIPPLLIPIVTALYPASMINGKSILKLMVGSFLTSVLWYMYGFFNRGEFLLNLEPFIPALIISVIIYIYEKARNIYYS